MSRAPKEPNESVLFIAFGGIPERIERHTLRTANEVVQNRCGDRHSRASRCSRGRYLATECNHSTVAQALFRRIVSTRFLHPHRTKPVLLPAISHRSSAAWLQVLTHSSSAFPSQAMHPPPPAQGPPPEGRDWRGRKMMEETMRVLTINELMRLTRIELCGLAAADHSRAAGTSAKARRSAQRASSPCATSAGFLRSATYLPSRATPLPVRAGRGNADQKSEACPGSSFTVLRD